MLVLRRRRCFHVISSSFCSSSSRTLSTSASSLVNLFRVGNQSLYSNTRQQHQHQQQRFEKQHFIFSKWCERSQLSSSVVSAIIRQHSKSFQDSKFSGEIIFYGLLKGDQVIDKEAANVLIEIAESGVFPSAALQLAKLITKLCRSGFVGKGWDFFHTVRKKGCFIGISSCNTLLTGLRKERDFEKMNLLFSEMKDWGIQPDMFTHGILMDYLCKSNQVENARKLFDKLSIKEQPSAIMCSTIINGLCMEGRLEDAVKLHSEMMHKYGHPPDTITYTCIINGYCKLGDIDTAIKLLARMKAEGLAINMFTVNAVIDGMCRIGRIGSALDFFREQCSDNHQFPQNLISYNILIGAFLNVQNVSKAMELYDEMLIRGQKPNRVTYTIMISGLSTAGNLNKAHSLASQMREEGFRPQMWCYNTLINGFSKKNRPDKMHNLLDEMETYGLKPDVITYNILISFSASKGDVSTANLHFNDMISCGHKPTVETYGALIHGYCKSGEFDEAMKILRNMSETGIQPSNVIYSTMFNHLSNEKSVECVLSLLDEMRAEGVMPNTFTYNIVFRCLCCRNARDEAYVLMNNMIEDGCKPDCFTLKILTEWFSSADEIDRLKRFMGEFVDVKA
ncbi:hypothetical protein ZOSMA_350G00140 [Zostera marina]|uniref:Pentatricopeptide repeat-containing protein n=1 Tax=Zostera marina TaxID=29655 RepID=A0A0K9P8Z6_ZOSMR|nr:hypothetical protein ZOSMA_350G00140 [Zostera marina]